MSCSKYKSNRETTNLARLARIILGPCTDILRAVLTKVISYPALEHNFNTYVANSQAKQKQQQHTISKYQHLISSKNVSDFDITMLYFLLRNVCSIPPHANQWGKEPIQKDRSVSANIERIRLIRNEYGHFTQYSLSDVKFQQTWRILFQVFKELECYIGTSTTHQDSLKELKCCSMDPEMEQNYIHKLTAYEHLQETVKNIEGN